MPRNGKSRGNINPRGSVVSALARHQNDRGDVRLNFSLAIHLQEYRAILAVHAREDRAIGVCTARDEPRGCDEHQYTDHANVGAGTGGGRRAGGR